jgi:hypothetical protein
MIDLRYCPFPIALGRRRSGAWDGVGRLPIGRPNTGMGFWPVGMVVADITTKPSTNLLRREDLSSRAGRGRLPIGGAGRGFSDPWVAATTLVCFTAWRRGPGDF